MRRRLLLAVPPSLWAGRAFAAAYPRQTISFLVPDGVGGGADTYVHEYAAQLSTYFDPPVQVAPVNDQGANGQKAALDLFQAAPDGYTIGMLGDVTGVKQEAGLLKQLTYIANVGKSAFGIAVAADSSIRSVADLLAAGAKKPVTFASSGKTALSYFAMQLFCTLNNLPHNIIVGYKGSTDAMVAVARGDADATAQSLPTLLSMEKAGLLRLLFVYADKSPVPGIADATSLGQPALAQVTQWRFVAGPPQLPAPIVDRLSAAFKAISENPATIAWSEKVHVPLDYRGPAATRAAVEAQIALTAKWQGRF
jgi:tripartite-type tricarboxylate transporter receptor subunit TctC